MVGGGAAALDRARPALEAFAGRIFHVGAVGAGSVIKLANQLLVGANTVAVDDPQLTVRDERDQPIPHQPLRVVMGERDLDPSHRVFDAAAETLHLRTRDPETALKDLVARNRQHVLLEGGPRLAAAFLAARLVDEVVAYVAPMLLGSGRTAIGDLGITTVADALHLPVTDVRVLEPLSDGDDVNVRITMSGPARPEETL
jgi:diaminohydroxyphosphoribosylaminopyrimidine deaminase/5-amino-6-(5-phosphoribosylamino)uracil reductase